MLRRCGPDALERHAGRAVGASDGLCVLGLFGFGCCWALMLVAFAAGMADLRLMAAFTALMAYEKVGPRGDAAARIAGVVLVVLGGAGLVAGV